MPRIKQSDVNAAAGRRALKAIRLAKASCTGAVFRALHVAEGQLMSALHPGTYRKRAKPMKRRKKKAAKE